MGNYAVTPGSRKFGGLELAPLPADIKFGDGFRKHLNIEESNAMAAILIEKDQQRQKNEYMNGLYYSTCEEIVGCIYSASFIYAVMLGIMEQSLYAMKKQEVKLGIKKADRFRYARFIEDRECAWKKMKKQMGDDVCRNLNVPLHGRYLSAWAYEYQENMYGIVAQKVLGDLTKDSYHTMFKNLHKKLQNLHTEKLNAMTTEERWSKKGESVKPVAYPSYLTHLFLTAGIASVIVQNIQQLTGQSQTILRAAQKTFKGISGAGATLDVKPTLRLKKALLDTAKAMLGEWNDEIECYADKQFYVLGNMLMATEKEHTDAVKECKREALKWAWLWYVSRIVYHQLRKDRLPDKVRQDVNHLLGVNNGLLLVYQDSAKIRKRLDLADGALKNESGKQFNDETVDDIRGVIFDMMDEGVKLTGVERGLREFNKILDGERERDRFSLM